MDISNDSAGKIIRHIKGYKAFLPTPLPPSIEWNIQLVNSLSRADYLLGKLAREGSKLPNPHLLIRPFITREAVLSSQIEGTQTTIGEVLAQDAAIRSKEYHGDLQEVQNYIKALDHGLELLDTLPLSLRLVKNLHEKLMQGVRGDHATPGQFRTSQNWIGSPGCTLNTAKYVPPPPDVLMDCLGEFESFLHNKSLPPLIHIALCHYQFEAIHPFLDGNGRVGRLLITLLLIYHKILPAPLLYLSAFFEITRGEYYRFLFEVSSRGNWNEWLVYFLNGVALQAQDVLSRTERINALIEKWKTEMTKENSSVSMEIINKLASNPYLTIKKIAQELNVAYSTAQRGILKLEAKQIIRQTRNNKRDRVYCAVDILNILEEPTNLQLKESI